MIYKLSPRGYKKKLNEWLKFSGSKRSARHFVNNVFAVSFAAGFVGALFLREYFFLAWIAVFLGVFALLHGFLALGVDRRSKYVENILPDALQLMAANSRAGYIPSRSLLLSARPEFGPLSDAIKNVGKDIMTGKSLDEGLQRMTENIRSDSLERTVRLILEGTRSGGQFAALLEETAADLRAKQAIQKEMRANITMYTIFVGFAGCMGAPVLYALSGFLVETLGRFGEVVTAPEAMSRVAFANFGGINVSADFMFFFSLIAILVTTVFGSMIIGLIGTGKGKAGIKYMPVLLGIALGDFFVTKYIISNILGVALPI